MPPFIIAFFFFLVTVSSQCTYTQNHWITLSEVLNLNDTLCGEPWQKLLQIDASRMIVRENSPWIIAFHQYASAVMNKRRFGETNHLYNMSDIDEAILLIGDSLERTCHNVSQWRLLPSREQAFITLYDFNHGLIPRHDESVACRDEYKNMVTNETFYYFNTPDIIATRDPTTNLTHIRSLYGGFYNTQTVLYVALGLSGLILGLVLLKLVMTRADRRYFARRKQVASQNDTAIELDNMGLSDNEIILSGDDSSIEKDSKNPVIVVEKI